MRTITCLVATAFAFALAGCAGDVAHLSAADGGSTRLAPQESNGLRAEATLHETPSASGHSLVLALRLVNIASVTRRNISVSRVTLGSFANDARPAASANLYGRGSSVDYPAVSRWQLPANVSAQQQLDVEVRYEIQAQPSVAHFRWTVDAGASMGG